MEKEYRQHELDDSAEMFPKEERTNPIALIIAVIAVACIAVAMLWTATAEANHVKNRVLDGKTLVASAPCKDKNTRQVGVCEIYIDSDGGEYIAFWSDQMTVEWVRQITPDGSVTVYTDGEVAL